MYRCRLLIRLSTLFLLSTVVSFSANAQTQLSPKLRQKTDKLVNESLAQSRKSALHA